MTNDKKIEALKQIEQMSDSGSYEDTIVRMKSIATEALKLAAQPKQEAIEGDLQDFLKEVKVQRDQFVKAASNEWWIEIGVERVVFEDILIMYDQMYERLKNKQ